MKVQILIFSLLFSLTAFLHAETQYKHGIGASAGFVTGYGLSYRFISGENTYQVTFTPFINSSFAVISLGGTFMHNLYKADFTDLFFYTGIHCLYNDSNFDEWGNQKASIRINIGGGPGIRFKFSKHVMFDIMFGYAVYNEIGEPTSLNFTAETGLFYYF